MVCGLGRVKTQGVTGVKPVGFHPTSADCGLVPVLNLNLWPLAKVSDLRPATTHLSVWFPRHYSRSTRARAGGLTGIVLEVCEQRPLDCC